MKQHTVILSIVALLLVVAGMCLAMLYIASLEEDGDTQLRPPLPRALPLAGWNPLPPRRSPRRRGPAGSPAGWTSGWCRGAFRR